MGRYVEDGSGGMAYRGGWRPHMERREGETVEQHNYRLSRSCYRCGHYEEDEAVLDEHEDGCRGARPAVEQQS